MDNLPWNEAYLEAYKKHLEEWKAMIDEAWEAIAFMEKKQYG